MRWYAVCTLHFMAYAPLGYWKSTAQLCTKTDIVIKGFYYWIELYCIIVIEEGLNGLSDTGVENHKYKKGVIDALNF